MKKLLVVLTLFSLSCGPLASPYSGPLNYEIMNPEVVDINLVDQYVRRAVGDFAAIEYLDETVFEETKVLFDYHNSDPWLCKEYDSQTCIVVGSHGHYIAEIDLNGYKYSHTYHEYMHFLLHSHGVADFGGTAHHKWMRKHNVCQNWEKIGGTHCSDVPFKL